MALVALLLTVGMYVGKYLRPINTAVSLNILSRSQKIFCGRFNFSYLCSIIRTDKGQKGMKSDQVKRLIQ